MHALLHDLRYALRAFRSGHSGLLLSAVVLAAAIAAATTTFSVVSGVLLRALPVTEPERVVNLRVAPLRQDPEEIGGATMSNAVVDLLLSPVGAFEEAAPFFAGGTPILTGLGEPERLTAPSVPASFFSVLGTGPLLGRVFTPSDAAEGGAIVVLSHRFWKSRLGGRPDVIGSLLTLDGTPHEVVGVMPPGFAFPEGTHLWRPAPPLVPGEGSPSDIQGRFWMVARLAPGVSLEEARARLAAPFAAHAREHPGFANWRPNLAPLPETLVGTVRKPLLLLLAGVGLVLLIACANVASVLLARGMARRRELAIRLSIGASRGRLARQLLTEAVLLAVLAGAGGVLLAWWAVPALVALVGDQLPRAAEIGIDRGVLGAALAASTLTGLAAGSFPALLAVRHDVTAALKDGSEGSGASGWRLRVGEALVVAQVALGTLLLAGAGLLGGSFVKLMSVDFGFDPARPVVAQLRLPGDSYDSPEAREAFAARVLERAAALPGVQAAAVSTGVPFDEGAIGGVVIEGENPSPEAPPAYFTGVTPDYFRVIGVRALRGRTFRGTGAAEGDAVVVNEAFVNAFLRGRDPIGRGVTYFGEERGTIVGVVSDTRQRSPQEPALPEIYTPAIDGTYLKVSVRTVSDPGAAVGALRRAIREVDPLLPIDRVGVLSELISESVARERFYSVVLGASALLALLITALGMYGLASVSVVRRLREIGIRMALGATGRHIRALAAGRTALLAALGTGLGLAAAAATTRLLEGLLYELSPSDPLVFAAVACVLAAVAVVAAYAPARRAARVDPMVVLRAE